MEMLNRVDPSVSIRQVVQLKSILMDTHAQSSIFGQIDVGVIEKLLLGQLFLFSLDAVTVSKGDPFRFEAFIINEIG